MLYLFIVGWCAKISYKLALISYSTVNELFQRKRSKLGLKNTLVLDLLDFFYGAISSRAILKLTALVPRKIAGYSTVLPHYLPFVRQNKASLLEIPQNGVVHLVTLGQLRS